MSGGWRVSMSVTRVAHPPTHLLASRLLDLQPFASRAGHRRQLTSETYGADRQLQAAIPRARQVSQHLQRRGQAASNNGYFHPQVLPLRYDNPAAKTNAG